MDLRLKNKKMLEDSAEKTPHYGFRKLSAGVASVLLSTTLWVGNSSEAHAATETANAKNTVNDNDQTDSSVKTESGLVVQSAGAGTVQNNEAEQNSGSNSTKTSNSNEASTGSTTATAGTESNASASTTQTDGKVSSDAKKASTNADAKDASGTTKSDAQKSDSTTDTAKSDEAKTNLDSSKKADDKSNADEKSSEEKQADSTAANKTDENKTDSTTKSEDDAQKASETSKTSDTSNSNSSAVSVTKDEATGATSVTVVKNDAPTTNTVSVNKLTASTLASLSASSAAFSPRMLMTSLAATNTNSNIKVYNDGLMSMGKIKYNFNKAFVKPVISSKDSGWKLVQYKNNWCITYTHKFPTNSFTQNSYGMSTATYKPGAITITLPNSVTDETGKKYDVSLTFSNITFKVLGYRNNVSHLYGGNSVTWTVLSELHHTANSKEYGTYWLRSGQDDSDLAGDFNTSRDGKIGTQMDISFKVVGASADNTNNMIPFYFYDLDQPDKTLKGAPDRDGNYNPYTNANGVLPYTEQVRFLSGWYKNAHTNAKTIVKEDEASNRFYQTQQTTSQDLSEFVQLVHANGAKIHWAGSNAGTRFMQRFGAHDLTAIFVDANKKKIKTTHGEYQIDQDSQIFHRQDRSGKVIAKDGYYIKSVWINGAKKYTAPDVTSTSNNYITSYDIKLTGITSDQKVETELAPIPMNNVKRLNDTVTRTIHYVVKGGKVAAPADNVDTLTFGGAQTLDSTGKVLKTEWDANQDFDDVYSPELKGYTVDKEVVSNKNIAHDAQDITVTVTYTPEIQKAHVTYHDDTANKDLKTDDLSGESSTIAYMGNNPYTTGANINTYKSQGYELVSDDTNGGQITLDNDSSSDQYYVVHLKHATHTAQISDDVNRTIEYKVQGGNHPAPAAHNDSLHFNGTQTIDSVTGQVLSTNWDANKDFADVTSPDIQGYTVDRKVVSNTNIAHDAADIHEVVIYKADNQKVHITYHDDTANKDLKTDDLNGESDTITYTNEGGWHAYTTEANINNYKSQGYDLVSDDTGGKQIMLDHDSSKDQYFVVHLKHGTHTAQISDDVNRTINYTMKDGSKAPAQVKDSIHFNGTQTIDNVTKQVINTTWDPNKDFNDITSPTVKGYTPDRKVVSDKNIAHDHADIVENVVYTPDPQKAIVTYIDQTSGEELRTDTMNGVTHGHSGYTTKDKIKNYEDNGYALVSDQTNGNEIIYDDDDAVDQKYFVYLKHTYITITETTPQTPGAPINPNPNGVKYPGGVDKNSLGRDVNRTIIYKMSDGSKAPDQVKDKLHFTDTKVFDKVTGKMVSEKWSDNQDFKDINSPAVKGYTPDRKVVSDKNISYSHDDIVENVLYTPDPQKATVIYIDQTTGKTLKTDNLNGVTHGHSGYTTKSNIQNYEDNGYALVSDETKGEEIIYDDDDAVDQKYIVYLKHTYQTIKEGDKVVPGTAINKNPDGVKYPDGVDDASLGHDVKRDITYRMSDGTQAPGPVDSVLHFTATKVIDKVTGEILSTEWSPAQDYDDVVSPDIKGYTPDQKVISDKGITHEHSDIHEIVTYDPNPQKATVTYIDATTGKVIHVRNLAGKSNGHSGYTTAEEIQALKNAGYVLVSDETNGNEVVFDDDDSVDQAYVVKLAHRIDDSEEKHTATRTIRLHNPDGTVKTVKQVAHVQRKVMTDAVTGQKTYGDWTTDNWALFNTPKIKGYTPSLDKVIEKLVTGDTKDETVDIYYKKNPEPKKPEKPAETPKAPEEKTPEAAPAQTVETPQLPATGNEKDNAVLAAGTFATGASLLATVLKRRMRSEN